jgi:hypothetical protein
MLYSLQSYGASALRFLLSALSFQLSALRFLLSAFRFLLSAFSFRLYALCFLLFAFLLLPFFSSSQIIDPTSNTTEQQLENATENNEDTETEDDAYLQQLIHFIKNPVNLNTAGEEELKELQLLSALQIENCISYRNLLGNFISIYELQAIPGWSIALIEKLQPYITIRNTEGVFTAFKNRLRGGEHSILSRVSQGLEKSGGYTASTSANYYTGSPLKLLMRYKYQFKNLLQYGVLAEKDAGEQFFKGGQKQGFDFYSAHFFIRNIGIIKALALGDFTVNLGQGLTQWQSLAFKKGAEVLNIKREGPVIRPYNSAGESNFHRGTGITIAKNNISATVFLSYKKLDANMVADSSGISAGYISSLQTSGYHRTKSEIEDRSIQRQFVIGANIALKYKSLHLGVNALRYNFKLPLQKDNEPYNIYALHGTAFENYSLDYSYTFKNLHFFGEAAAGNKWNTAFVNGVLLSISAAADFSLLYRNIAAGYQSLYSNAFTENTLPSNEKGLYTGLNVHPGNQLRLAVYTDMFKFPWLRYRVDAPSAGTDYLVQLTYTPNKQLEILSRFHTDNKAINITSDQLTLSSVAPQPKKSWRTQFICKINRSITLKSRVELLWFSPKTKLQEQGFSTYFDFLYKPGLKPWAANMRFQYFDSDGYNSRLYAYENDVLFSYAIPVFYNKGLRIYINYYYNINKSFFIWAKIARTLYSGQTVIGSGLDEIPGNKKTDLRLQLLYKF